MATAFVQKASQSSGTTTGHTLAFPGNVTAGSFLVAFVRQTSNAADTPTDFSDNINGAWTAFINDGGGNSTTRNYCYYKKNSAAGAITVSGTVAVAKVWRWCIAEYSGVDTTTPIDDSYEADFPTGTSINTGNVTTTVANGHLVSCLITNSVETTIVPAGAETERLEQSGLIQLQDRFSTTTGTYQAAWTINPTSPGFKVLLALRPATGASPPTITNVDSDNDITATQTGVVITGTNFEASQGTGTVKLWDGTVGASIVSTCTVTAWGATSITFTVVQGNVLYGTGKSIQVTTNGALNVAKGVTLSVPSGTSKTVVTTLKALTWDARGTPSRLTPKGTSVDATADCTGAVQFDYIRSAGSGALTVDVDGRVSWATAATQMTWRWHNGAIWSSVFTWDLRGLFPVFSGPNEPDRTFTQNSAITTVPHVQQFSFVEALTPVVYSLQGGSIAGLAYSSSTAAETGTPTTVATNTGRSIRATNSEGSYVDTNTFTRTIQAAPNPPFFSGTIGDQVDDVSTTFSLDVSGFFTFTTSYASTGDPLPAGLTLNTGTGVISGTSTTAGIYSGIQITGSGTGTPAASNQFTIEIAAVGTIATPNLIGLSAAAANSAITGAALTVGLVTYQFTADTTQVDKVMSQSPDAGILSPPSGLVNYALGALTNPIAFYWLPTPT